MHAIKSQNLQSKELSNYTRFHEHYENKLHANDRLVPDVGDDGSIDGVYLMMNTFCTERPPTTLTNSKEEIMNHPSLVNDPKKAKWLISKIK